MLYGVLCVVCCILHGAYASCGGATRCALAHGELRRSTSILLYSSVFDFVCWHAPVGPMQFGGDMCVGRRCNALF